jgi:hypothetical protein
VNKKQLESGEKGHMMLRRRAELEKEGDAGKSLLAQGWIGVNHAS